MRTIYCHKLNKGFNSKFPEGDPHLQTQEEGRRAQRREPCGNNNKNEDMDSNINTVNSIREVDVLLSVHQL